MSFKVEITPIPNSNKNRVSSYNETNTDSKKTETHFKQNVYRA